MRSHPKASSAEPTQRQARSLGGIFRGGVATGGRSGDGGSGAPALRRISLVALAFGLAVAVFGVGATCAFAAPPAFERLADFGPDGTEAAGFLKAGPVAVDQSEETVYVLDPQAGTLYKYDFGGHPVDFGGLSPNVSGNELSGLDIAPDQFGSNSQVAVDSHSHTVYLTGGSDGSVSNAVQAFHSDGEPAIFTTGPGAGTNEIPASGLKGVAVDSNGAIYLAGVVSGDNISIYSQSGALLVPSVTAQTPGNLAVGTNGTIYALDDFITMVENTPSEFPVTTDTTYAAAAEPGPRLTSLTFDSTTRRLFGLGFERNQVEVFSSKGGIETAFPDAGGSDALGRPYGVAVATIEQPGIEGGITRVFVTDNPEGGLAQAKIFQERVVIAAPSIEASAALSVTADTAKLRAEVNPNARATKYHFEYGTENCSLGNCTNVVPVNSELGPGRKGVFGYAQLLGLQPGTIYHYRVVAENEIDTTYGPDKTFTTEVSALGFQLGDSRAWEMVSPPNKHLGTLSMPRYQAIVRAAADGEGLAYASVGSLDADSAGSRLPEEAQNLARREGGNWRSEDISAPNTEAAGISGSSQYQLFDPDLSQALLKPYDQTLLSPAADERTPYLRTNGDPPAYMPLLSNKEGFANVPSGEQFGGAGIQLQGANSTLTDVVLSTSTVPLITGAPANSLYLWHAGVITPVSKLTAAEGSEWAGRSLLGSGNGSVRHAISDDGSRVFWGSGDYGSGAISLSALYLRDTETEETVRLDVPEAGAGGGEAAPLFQGANAEGTVVYFTDSRQLTTDASPEGRDLYRCEIPAGAAAAGCATLADISAPSPGSGESAQIGRRIAPGLSDDGSRIYFVAEDVLDSAPNSQGEKASSEQSNLYLYEEGAGVRFIATLTVNDRGVTGGNGYSAALTAAGSPSGRYLAFMSERGLTGYDNRDAASVEPDQEVFRYDAVSDELQCASCNPSGGSPSGQRLKELTFGTPMADRRGLWAKQWLAATLPETGGQEGGGDGNDIMLTQPRYVLDNGRVFFNAIDSLVPADSNGNWDVYEYESMGVGSCDVSSAGAAVSRSGGGCVSLISSGTAGEEAAFLDASESGDDAFFLSTAKLVEIDQDSQYDAYDARVDGVPQKLTPQSECLGEACQPAPSPPSDATPASAAFHGAGNIAPKARRCPKGKRRVAHGRRSRCVAVKHKRKHHPHSRTSASRRAGR